MIDVPIEKVLKQVPSFKNILNIDKQKVKSCSKSKTTAKEVSCKNKIHQNNIQNEKQNDDVIVGVRKTGKNKWFCNGGLIDQSSIMINNQQQNGIQQLEKIGKKIAKVEFKVNEQQKIVHNIEYERKIRENDDENYQKRKCSSENNFLARLNTMKNFLNDYSNELIRQTNEIEEGYYEKLNDLSLKESDKNEFKFECLAVTKAFGQNLQAQKLEQRINKLHSLLF